MSLEKEIAELRLAVQELTKVIINDIQTDIYHVNQPEAQPEPEAQTDSVPFDVITHEDVKQACLHLSRTVEGGKDKAKAILSEFGARKATDIPEQHLQSVMDKLKAAQNG